MPDDVDIRHPDIRFAAVARAVIVDGGLVLVARYRDNVNTFLPGGHVRAGEPLRAGLAREVEEELGLAATVGDYLGMIESWWTDDIGYFGVAGRETHQIDHYFSTTITGIDASTPPPSTASHLTFFWAPVDELSAHTLLPAPLQQHIPRYASGDRSAWWWSAPDHA